MTALPPVCILAGGLGSRLGGRVSDTPKPLLEVAGEPFLLHQLRLLAANGAERVVLCVGYLGDTIESRIGDEHFGIRIGYSYDSPGLDGTLGAIRRALPLLGDEFLVLYGDTYLRIDYADAVRVWRASGCLALMTVLRNRGRWGQSNAIFDGRQVTTFDKENPLQEMEWIDYGLGGFSAGALSLVGADVADLAVLQRRLAATGELAGYAAVNRFYEIGTPEALRETDAFLRRL